MKKIILVLSWLAVIIIMSTIFYFSSQVADDSNEVSGGFIAMLYKLKLRIFGQECSTAELNMRIEALQSTVRKIAHFAIYSALGFLFANAYTQSGLKSLKKIFIVSLLSSAIYASTDEIHQLFVEGRSGEIRDVLIDSTGAALGAFAFILIILGRNLWISKKQLKN